LTPNHCPTETPFMLYLHLHWQGTDNFPTPLTLFCALLPNIVTDGVENCGYQLLFKMFSHLFGKRYVAPASSTAPTNGTFYAFDQTNLTASGNSVADFMDSKGYLYVPARCQVAGNTCKLHIALHGCLSSIYNEYVCIIYIFQESIIKQCILTIHEYFWCTQRPVQLLRHKCRISSSRRRQWRCNSFSASGRGSIFFNNHSNE